MNKKILVRLLTFVFAAAIIFAAGISFIWKNFGNVATSTREIVNRGISRQIVDEKKIEKKKPARLAPAQMFSIIRLTSACFPKKRILNAQQ